MIEKDWGLVSGNREFYRQCKAESCRQSEPYIDRYTYSFKTIVGPEKRQGWISYRYGSEAKYLQFDCHKEVNKQVDRERHKIF